MKYKNKDGIELSYEGHENDYHAHLIKEVIGEAIKLGDTRIGSRYPLQGWREVKDFLVENFSLEEDILKKRDMTFRGIIGQE